MRGQRGEREGSNTGMGRPWVQAPEEDLRHSTGRWRGVSIRRAESKQDNPEMIPAEPVISILTPEPQPSPELETKFLTCLVNPGGLGYFQLDASWPRAGGWGRPAKDTGFLRVGHSGRGATDDVAVEGNLEGVAIRSVVQQPTEEATASSCFHGISVKGRAGL